MLNWVLLSGLGVHHDTPALENASQTRSASYVPDSTTIMGMEAMIDQVYLDLLRVEKDLFLFSSIFLPSRTVTPSLKARNLSTSTSIISWHERRILVAYNL